MIKIIFWQVENGLSARFEREFSSEATWVQLIEDGVVPGIRALGYSIPETEKIIGAFDVE